MSDTKKTISFFGALKEYHLIKEEIDKSIFRVLESGRYILGEEVFAFEREFAEYCGVNYAVGCASGTEALALAIMSLGIGVGDKVITVSNTATPTVAAIFMAGARPVFVDIDPETYNIDPREIERLLREMSAEQLSEIKAIIPVHLYGSMADMERINGIAEKYQLKVIEDAAQAHGAQSKGCKAGTLGDLGCFSFYPTKNLGCFGDGGVVTTNSLDLYQQILKMRNYGQKDRYHCEMNGINSRLDEIQAAVLRVKLEKLDDWNAKRRKIAELYNEELQGVRLVTTMNTNAGDVFHLYVVRSQSRDKLKSYLQENGIDALVHYPIPVHLQKAYTGLNYKKGDLPSTELVVGEILSLPIYPELSYEDIRYVTDKIKQFYKGIS